MEKLWEIKEKEFQRLNTKKQEASRELLCSPKRRFKYCNSLEKWMPGTGHIYCPKCGVSKKPLIDHRAERFINNECGTCCLLSCWPFCFIPWVIPGKNVEYLYCANCKNSLGIYNPTTNCVKPNYLYVPTGDDFNGMEPYNHESENINGSPDQDRDYETNRSDISATSSESLFTITGDEKISPSKT